MYEYLYFIYVITTGIYNSSIVNIMIQLKLHNGTHNYL